MAKISHFEAGAPGFVDSLNELVDKVNELEDALAKKADKRATKTASK